MEYSLLIELIAGHYLADFGLQTQHMSEKKALVFIEPMGFHALTAHAFIHGLVIGLLSGSLTLAVVIGVTHWLIDFGKASKWLQHKLGRKSELYGIHVDQALHLGVIVLSSSLIL